MFDIEQNYNSNQGQRDITLVTNEFAYVCNKTSGQIKVYVGPITLTISQQESLVIFDEKTKMFKEIQDIKVAKQLFTSAPEGWYVVLKNPAPDFQTPELGKANTSPQLDIGRKVIISGPCSFPLFPGQMTKVVQGHRLRSNQYLLARIYDAEIANKNEDLASFKEEEKDFVVGQILVIKGTETSFFIPSTGVEVIPIDGVGKKYVREAVTLERLEYAILKNEDGEKRYVHGPDVAYPKPTEVFVQTPKGGNIFRALELSDISGIYVKVIDGYEDKDGTEHHIGEELFITGKEQRIYYPRPEHALIQYDGKYMHHAIAIPKGRAATF